MCNLCVVRVTLPSVRTTLPSVRVTLPSFWVTLPGVDHSSNRGRFSWQKLKRPIKTSREIKCLTIDPTKK